MASTHSGGAPGAIVQLSGATGAGNAPKLAADQLSKLSDKLKELVGEDAVHGFLDSRNERGELLNEDGLPIIEITEPVPATESQKAIAAPEDTAEEQKDLQEDEPLRPLASLDPQERDRLRQERNRLLDLLEEEERQEQARDRHEIDEERRQELRRRKEVAKKEVEDLKAAREMHKKMGKALLQNMADARSKNESYGDDADQDKMLTNASGAKKKSVTFAASEGGEADSARESPASLGYITPAKLRWGQRPTLLQKTQHLPMKMDVVERTHGSPAFQPPSVEITGDSDDEDIAGSPVPIDSDSDEEQKLGGGDESDTESDASTTFEEEEVDFDTAAHQREIALEYYTQRHKMAEAAMQSLASRVDDDTDAVDQTASSSKPAVSRFMADRIATSYNATTSRSRGSVIPAASSQTLQRAIRMGKLDAAGHLVGGSSDSEPEDDAAEEVIRLLSKGAVFNAGPMPDLVDGFGVSAQASPAPAVSQMTSPGTPISNEPRSSPKLGPASDVAERNLQPSAARRATPASSPFSMVVESPSFPRTSAGNPPPDTSSRRPDRPPVVLASSVRETRSSAAVTPLQALESPSFPAPAPQRPPGPPGPPAVLSSGLREFADPTSLPGYTIAQKKVSRFMADRR